MNSISDMIEFHSNHGEIEDAYINVHIDDKILRLNTFTLVFTSNRIEKQEVQHWNDTINEEIRKDRELHREIKEFRVLFEVLHRLKIKKGTITKSERPDFVLTMEGKTIGIEITQIYTGNDWAVEKIREDIRQYGIDSKELPGYIEYRKLDNKIATYQMKENLVIKPLNNNEKELFQTKIKNKIFEKIRKVFDEYDSYDENIVIAKVVSPENFISFDELEKFHQEIQFFVSHLEVDLSEKKCLILLKLGKKIVRFDVLENHVSII